MSVSETCSIQHMLYSSRAMLMYKTVFMMRLYIMFAAPCAKHCKVCPYSGPNKCDFCERGYKITKHRTCSTRESETARLSS